MSFTENLYLKRQIQKLQEENKQLREVLNEARIRRKPLPDIYDRNPFSNPDWDRRVANTDRNLDRQFDARGIISALVDPNHEIHKPENADEKASILRVLNDMQMIRMEREVPSGKEYSYANYGTTQRPAAEGGPGTGTANVEDMRRYIKATRPSRGFGYVSIRDKPNS
jgi:hypothetical protein